MINQDESLDFAQNIHIDVILCSCEDKSQKRICFYSGFSTFPMNKIELDDFSLMRKKNGLLNSTTGSDADLVVTPTKEALAVDPFSST